MNKEKIQQLRSKINIPLAKAIELLKLTDNDIEQAEKLFHEQNIDELVSSIENCEYDVAKKYYDYCNFNMEKAKEKIQDYYDFVELKNSIITTREDKRRYREMGFDISSFDKERSLLKFTFIPFYDITEELLQVLNKHYPSELNDGYTRLDMTAHNYFSAKEIKQIILGLRNIKADEVYELFYHQLADWFEAEIHHSNDILIYGNI